MRRVLSISVLVVAVLAIAACSGGPDAGMPDGGEAGEVLGPIGPAGRSGPAARPTTAPLPTGTPMPAFLLPTPAPAMAEPILTAVSEAAGAQGPAGPEGADGAMAFQVVEEDVRRKIVSTADTNLAVEDVEAAVVQVRTIAESLGGFIQTLTTSGTGDAQRAQVTSRVPSERFFLALERIEALGEVHSRNVGSEDVTEQHIDLQARLKSAQREEESLLRLLDKAEAVFEILEIERELFRVRGEIERLEAQLQFLERRVDLATLTVNLFAPEARPGTPPWASVNIEVPDVAGAVDEVTALIKEADGIVDSASVITHDGGEQAGMEFRIFAEDFDRVLATVEGMGEVEFKEFIQGDLNEDDPRPKEPRSRIRLSLRPPPIAGSPPSAVLTVGVPDVDEAVSRVKAIVAELKGVVDQSIVSFSEDEKRASLRFRVFAGDFQPALTGIEGLGRVESEQVSEETLTGVPPGKDPDSYIELNIQERARSQLGGILLVSIGGPLVVLALVYGAFLLGRRRGRATAGG